MKQTKGNMDSQADAAPRRRPGRPRISETGQEAISDETRRTRMRLAQRSYRSRKQTALVSAKARAEVLEVALDGSIDEFIKFYERVAKRERELPTGVMMQLNKTAMNIVSIARKARMEKSILANDPEQHLDEDEAASIEGSDSAREPSSGFADDLPAERRMGGLNSHQKQHSLMAHGEPVPVSQRLLLACLTRAVALLQLGNFSVVALTPAMLLPLQLERAESLLERVAYRLSGHPNAFFFDCQYSDGLNACLPKMMRLIEGNLNSLKPRSSPPNLERLQFGRTRTMLHTVISDLQGEWLEAPDVEEYLEQRGIFVRMGSPSDVISLSAPTADGSLSETDGLNLLRPRGIRISRPEALGDISNVQNGGPTNQGLGMLEKQFYSSDGNAEDDNGPARNAAIPEHDFTIFGRSFKEGQTVPTGLTVSEWYPEIGIISNNAINKQGEEDLRITIDLDKLIKGLADKAVCLGPCPGIRRIHVDEAIRGSVRNF